VPVLFHEVISGLQIDPSGIYVDCTFGGGGHSRGILAQLNDRGRMLAFDQDSDAARNIPDDPRLTFIPHNFRHLYRFLRLHNISKVNGILADLGVSSHQIDMPQRGFSTRFNSALDMRMNQSEKLEAAQVVRNYTEGELHLIFEKYGEVTNAKTLAKLIVQARKTQSMKTVAEFKNVLYPVVKGNPEKYFAQVFQALRIEVNDELGALKDMLLQVPDLLTAGGRVAIITFHSLEDRMVKNFFRYGDFEEAPQKDVYGNRPHNDLFIITKKALMPSKEETQRNPRSRSARLRIAEKMTAAVQLATPGPLRPIK